MTIEPDFRWFASLAIHCVISVAVISSYAQDRTVGSYSPSKTSFFPSYEEEARLRQKELEHALETTLGSIPFVSHVRVHLSSSSGDFFRSKASSSSASVILISDKPDRIEKEELKRLVSGAVSDVDENNVRVFVYRKGSEEASHQIKSEHEKNVSAELSTPRRVLIGVIMFVLGASTVVLGIGVIRYFRRRNMV